MAESHGLRLTSSTGRPDVTTLAEVNSCLAAVGAAVQPLNLTAAPKDVQELLVLETLTALQNQRLLDYFLLPRSRLLDVIRAAGREPHVPGGGALQTYVTDHDYWYPQMWLAEPGVDYSRFDRLHVNVAEDATGVDEVLQMVAGAGIVIVLKLADQSLLTLHVDCPDLRSGWTITYDGGRPHIGSVSAAKRGTKLITQVIGPAAWQMRYVE